MVNTQELITPQYVSNEQVEYEIQNTIGNKICTRSK